MQKPSGGQAAAGTLGAVIDLRSHDWGSDRFFDSAIVHHGFSSYLRDYDFIVEVPALRPDGAGSWIEGRYRYRFTHCVEASSHTALSAETWKASWTDEFTDYNEWERVGNPEGFVWGTEWANAYPGVKRIQPSEVSETWAQQLGQPMHEILIETNAYAVRLVCHAVRVDQLAAADPSTGEIEPWSRP